MHSSAARPLAGTTDDVAKYVNIHFRRPTGLPDLIDRPQLDTAAANHLRYWQLNAGFASSGVDVNPNLEYTQAPNGFTGITPADRCSFVSTTCVSEDYLRVPDLTQAVTVWMNAPYHGGPLFDANAVGCASDATTAICDIDQPPTARLTDPATINTTDSTVHVWPYNGASTVPITWYGAEEPDPLANYTGSHIVGPPIYLVCGNEPRLSVRLSRPNGTVIPLLATTPIQSKQASKSFDFGNGCASSSPVLWTLFPASKLAKGTRYSLRFTTTTRTRTVAFTTSDWTVRISTGRVRRTAVARVRVTVRSDTRFTLLVHVTRSVGKRTSFLHSWRFAEPAGTTTLRAQDLIGTRALAAAYRLSFSDASEPTRVKTIRLTVTE